MTKHDLTTEVGRESALLEVDWKVEKALKELGLPQEGIVELSNNYVSLFGYEINSSEIDIYTSKGHIEINLPTSGSFTPKNEGECWRIKAAAWLIENYAKANQIIMNGMNEYKELLKQIEEANK